MSGSDLTWVVENSPPSAARGGKSPVLLGLKALVLLSNLLSPLKFLVACQNNSTNHDVFHVVSASTLASKTAMLTVIDRACKQTITVCNKM